MASPVTLTENEKQMEIIKDTIAKLSKTITEIGTKLEELGWTPTGEKETLKEPQGKCKF